LDKKGSSILFLDPEPAIPISLCAGKLRIKEWLTKQHSEHWVATLGMRELKLFIVMPLEKLS
jgi:hypothetical protein